MEKDHKRVLLLLLLVFLIGLSLLLLVLIGRNHSTQPQRYGREFVSESSGYLESLDSSMPFFPEVTQCSNGTVPEPDSAMKGDLPAYSWRLLSFASAYKTTGDPKYLKLMEEDFSRIKSEANGAKEMGSLWQVYEAYQVSHEPKYLSFFLKRVYLLGFVLDAYVNDSTAGNLIPMTLVGYIRSALSGVRAMSLPEAQKVLGAELASESAIEGKEADLFTGRKLLDAQGKLLEEAMRLYSIVISSEYKNRYLGSNNFDQSLSLQCWKALGAYEMYLSTVNEGYLKDAQMRSSNLI